jgi:hypothetical protein
MAIWYIFPLFGILYQEKSDNPVPELSKSNLSWVVELLKHFLHLRQTSKALEQSFVLRTGLWEFLKR